MNIETESTRMQDTMISYNTCKGISIMQICLFMSTIHHSKTVFILIFFNLLL